MDVEQHIQEQLVVERVARWQALSADAQAQRTREWVKYRRLLQRRLLVIGWGYMVCASFAIVIVLFLPLVYLLMPLCVAPIVHLVLGALATPSVQDTPSSEAPPTLEELVIHHHHTAPKAAGGEVTEVS